MSTTTNASAAALTGAYFDQAEGAALAVRDGINALALIVREPWREPDKARNAIMWLADKLDLDAETLTDSLDQMRTDAGAQS